MIIRLARHLFPLLIAAAAFCSLDAQAQPITWSNKGDTWDISLGGAAPGSPAAAAPRTTDAAAHQEFFFETPAFVDFNGYQSPRQKERQTTQKRRRNRAGDELLLWQNEPGAPVLPFRPVQMVVPSGRKLLRVIVSGKEANTLPGSFLLEPAQIPVPLSKPETAQNTAPDSIIYDSSAVYPNRPWGSVEVQRLHGFSVLTLNLFPLQYSPAERRVSFFRRMTVSLVTAPADAAALAPAQDFIPVDPRRAAEVDSSVDNPEALAGFAKAPLSSAASATALPAGTYEYVIITTTALSTQFAPLIASKQQRGLTARIVTLSGDIYPNYTGTETHDNADKVRHFIRDAYLNWNTRWVLLGGDVEVVPHRGVWVSTGSYTETSMPTDEYFACLDGPWNNDRDALWGEGTDGTGGADIDKMAEVFIGRAPVSNATEAANFVSKVVRYESNAHINARKAIMLGESLDSYTQGSYSAKPIKDESFDGRWSVLERYDENGAWSGATFVNDLNASPHVVNHLGHANYTYNARIGNGSVAGLRNTDPYLIYSQGCMSGGFDVSDKCIAEEHVVDDHAAFAAVMNARYGWYSPGSWPGYSHEFAAEFWDALGNEGKIHLGQANRDSKDDNIGGVGSGGTYRWIFFELNLLGDPETPVQTFYSPPPAGTITGSVVQDFDANAQNSAGDAAAAGEMVYADLNDSGELDAGTRLQSAAGVPASLPGTQTVTSSIPISGLAGKIVDLNVKINVQIAYAYALRIRLYHPDGRRIKLADYVPKWEPDFTDTVFDDEAQTNIDSAAPPFTGSFRPAGLLSSFDGSSPNGTWTLEIYNRYSGETGTLNSWELEISYAEPFAASDPSGIYTITGLADGAYTVRHELTPGWRYTGPSRHDAAVAGGAASPEASDFFIIDDGDNDGLRNESDCAPGDALRWRERVYLDADGDGIRDDDTALVVSCFGDNVPAGYTINEGAPDNCPSAGNDGQEDSDGDGIGDPCDTRPNDPIPREEAPYDVPSLPLTGVWNGFNEQTNVVECANVGESPAAVTLTVIDFTGTQLGQALLSLNGHASVHVLLNDYPIVNRYGTYLVQLAPGHTQVPAITCQTLFYRMAAPEAKKQLEYAYSVPAGALLRGETNGMYNSMNPQPAAALPVLNWLSVYNPGSQPLNATVEVYNQDGTPNLIRSTRISGLAPQDRRDIGLGHPDGQVTGFYRIVPDDQQQLYGAFLSRYSRSASSSFNFAFVLFSKAGTPDSGPIPASTMGPAINWGEIANISAEAQEVLIEVFSRSRELLFSETRSLDPRSQYHVFLNQHIGENNVGFFRVRALSGRPALLVQSLFYGRRSADSHDIGWAYASQAEAAVAYDRPLIRSITLNTNLAASNWLKLFNPSDQPVSVELSFYDSAGSEITSRYGTVILAGSADIPLHEEVGPAFSGIVLVRMDRLISTELLRVYPVTPGSAAINFITNLRP